MPNLNLITHSLIPRSEAELVHNSVGDGNCGFRALAFELFGSEGLQYFLYGVGPGRAPEGGARGGGANRPAIYFSLQSQ